MTTCTYCGIDRAFPCRSTRDMEEEIARKECFASLMFMGGGERNDNQATAAGYWRMARREIGQADLLGGGVREFTLPP